MYDNLSALFSSAGLRLTAPRRIIFDALRRSDVPQSIVQLSAVCPTIDKASIYRTIALFDKHSITQRVPRGWKFLYELAVPFAPHHHHLICTQCGGLTNIESEQLETMITDITDEHQFIPTRHHFEITGICNNCK